MNEHDFLAERFEAERPRLRSVAYRMLGSLAEADDAVQEAWIRLSRSDAGEIDNLGGWLTTVVGRISLNMLRSRKSRGEESLDTRLPDPILAAPPSVGPAAAPDPEQEAVLADSVGLALLVVLNTLDPAERLAFVLHDMFGMPFDEIGPVVGRTPVAARQLASRARRRVQGAEPGQHVNRDQQRAIVEAFMNASRGGDFDALVALLDPNVTLRVDEGPGAVGKLVRGAREVASNALMFSRFAPYARLALVNGEPGAITVVDGELVAVLAMTIDDGKVTELNILADRVRLARLDLSFLDE